MKIYIYTYTYISAFYAENHFDIFECIDQFAWIKFLMNRLIFFFGINRKLNHCNGEKKVRQT